MANERVTAFMVQANGSRGFAVVVRGLKVLVSAEEGQHDAGLALAEVIAALGPAAPEQAPAARPASVIAPVSPAPAPAPAPSRAFAVGQRVRCVVHGAEGWHDVVEIGSGSHRGQIKVSNFRRGKAWCPAHNFVAAEAR